MALSNPYRGERRPGYVGQPLPDVSVQLVDDAGDIVTEGTYPARSGYKAPRYFWSTGTIPKRPTSFKEGWFCTGDIGVVEDGYFRIMGRVFGRYHQIGGYKLSALEIENKLLAHS